MDFFKAQDVARRKSKLLVVYFIAAVISMIAVIYAVTVVAWAKMQEYGADPAQPVRVPVTWWQPDLLAIVAAATLAVILLGSLFKSLALRAGGGAIAQSLGGQRVDPQTTDLTERRLFNVVEEMAIASGVRVPEVYVLPESGINAFAAGLSADDAAIAVTQGALNTLSRDELQGVVAHEFSHILNGDMRLNMRLIGLLFGILLLAIIGRVVLQSLRFSGAGRSRRGGRNSGGLLVVILALGFTLLVVGYLGVFFGRLIQAAVSRQREFLADASAVQFTRNPPGISGALKKIGGFIAGSRMRSAHATETAHMFFANALSSAAISAFATHPPLVERIRAIEPHFDGKFPAVAETAKPFGTETDVEGVPRARRERRTHFTPEQLIAALGATSEAIDTTASAALLAEIPIGLRAAARDPSRARAVVLALLAELEDAGTGRRQSRILSQVLDDAEIEAGAEAVAQLGALPLEARLALLDVALPAIRELPPERIQALLGALDQMALADYRVTPAEFAIQHIARRHLAAHAPLPPPLPGQTRVASAQSEDVAALLAVVARAGTNDPLTAGAAYTAGARHFGLLETDLEDRGSSASTLAGLATTLQRLERIALGEKRRLLESLAIAAGRDGTIALDELALVRAFSAALDCPAPLLAASGGVEVSS